MLVSFYSLLCGSPAFTGKTDEELKLNILCKNYTLDHPALKNVSFEALDLVKKLLRLDPMKRLSASGVLEHPWLKRVPGIICLGLSSLQNIDLNFWYCFEAIFLAFWYFTLKTQTVLVNLCYVCHLKRVFWSDYRQISRGLRNLSLKSNLPPTDSKKRRAEDEDLDKNLPQAKRWWRTLTLWRKKSQLTLMTISSHDQRTKIKQHLYFTSFNSNYGAVIN